MITWLEWIKKCLFSDAEKNRLPTDKKQFINKKTNLNSGNSQSRKSV